MVTYIYRFERSCTINTSKKLTKTIFGSLESKLITTHTGLIGVSNNETDSLAYCWPKMPNYRELAMSAPRETVSHGVTRPLSS
jgi:hypothetical protein